MYPHTGVGFKRIKPKYDVHVMRLPHYIYQLNSGSTEAALLVQQLYTCMYVCIHTHTPATTGEIDSLENSLPRAKKPMGGKTLLFFNPVPKNDFCEFRIIHSAS